MGSCYHRQVIIEPISQPLSTHLKAKPKIFQSNALKIQVHPNNFSLRNNLIVKH